MRRLRQEQAEVVAEHGPALGPAALCSMPYADAVVKEVERLMHASHGILRQTLADIEILGHRVPKGSILFIITDVLHATDPACLPASDLPAPDATPDGSGAHAGAAHAPGAAGGAGWRGAQLGPELRPAHMDLDNLAASFRPERWLAEPGKRPRAFYTFGAGAHSCLGMPFANAELKVFLVQLARGYELQLLTADVEWEPLPIYIPRRPVRMRCCVHQAGQAA